MINQTKAIYQMSPKILSICLNPTLQRTVVLPQLLENQVNRSAEYYHDASGKGVNVSRVLTQLGENAVHLTQLGGRFREYFLEMTQQDRIQIKWVESFSEIRSCYTLISRARGSSTEIVEEALPVAAGTESRVWELFNRLLPDFALVIISGSKAAGFSDAIFPKMVQAAKSPGKTVILDYRGKDLLNSLQFKPDFIKPNNQEFIDTFFPEAAPKSEWEKDRLQDLVHDKMRELHRDFGIVTILTNGSREITCFDHKSIRLIYLDKIKTVNTIGCGDAFTAGFASSWLKERAYLPALRKGLECAWANVRLIRPGVIE